MKSLENKIPPAIVWLVCAPIMKSIAYVLPLVALPHLSIVAVITTLIGIGAGIVGAWSFYRARIIINPPELSQATHSASERIYKLSRNPIYVGLACCLTFWAIRSSHLVPWSGVVLFIAYMTCSQITPEERVLGQKFDDEYQSYCLRIRRWL